MAKKHVKRCSVALAVRELQNKIPARNQSKSSRNWCTHLPEHTNWARSQQPRAESQLPEMSTNDRHCGILRIKRMSWGKDRWMGRAERIFNAGECSVCYDSDGYMSL